jgi:hypothetical protein
MSCSPLKVNRRFGETYRFHLQDRRISRGKTSLKAGGKQSFHTGFLLGLFFDPEDGNDMFPRHVG